MARRALLSEIWWQQATTVPQDEREIAKHYTLDRTDLDLIMRQNKTSNRLGLTCALALLRYPGRPLADGEILPDGVLRFLARQIGVDHRDIDRYFERPQSRRRSVRVIVLILICYLTNGASIICTLLTKPTATVLWYGLLHSLAVTVLHGLWPSCQRLVPASQPALS